MRESNPRLRQLSDRIARSTHPARTSRFKFEVRSLRRENSATDPVYLTLETSNFTLLDTSCSHRTVRGTAMPQDLVAVDEPVEPSRVRPSCTITSSSWDPSKTREAGQPAVKVHRARGVDEPDP